MNRRNDVRPVLIYHWPRIINMPASIVQYGPRDGIRPSMLPICIDAYVAPGVSLDTHQTSSCPLGFVPTAPSGLVSCGRRLVCLPAHQSHG